MVKVEMEFYGGFFGGKKKKIRELTNEQFNQCKKDVKAKKMGMISCKRL